MNKHEEKILVERVTRRLRSFTTRLFLRDVAKQYFEIPMMLTDAEALRILGKAIKAVEGEI